MQRHHRHLLKSRGRSRGFTLIDALIALAILAFGILGMTRLQARALAQSTESQSRMTAVQLADELISTALIDAANAPCYTLPAAGACGNPSGRTFTTAWEIRVIGGTGVVAALPGGAVTSTYTAATGRFTVRITWTGKESGDTRTQEATTDVRT
jgi:type IV pilus assembly protein PilV